jgi:hypothetical protein
MTAWIDRKPGFLGSRRPERRPVADPGVKPQTPAAIPDEEGFECGIIITPPQCPSPGCHSLDVRKYGSVRGIRYYRCKRCKCKFKGIVKLLFEIPIIKINNEK